MKRILFVDDEVQVLESIKRSLFDYCDDWEFSFANSGAEALEVLAQSEFDVIVSDMQMPIMDGTELLRQVQSLYPNIVRVMLTGQSDDEANLKALPVAHQFLSKPCKADVIIDIIERTCNLNDMLADDSISKIIGNIDSLPSLPRVYDELTAALADMRVPMKMVAKIVEQDVGMCAKILQIVNSAFFSLRRRITNIQTAISYIGANMIKNLVLSVEIFRVFEAQGDLPGFCMESEQRHALNVADIARKITQPHPMNEDAFAAGMLHDVGKLIIGSQLPDAWREIYEINQGEEEQRPIYEIEKEVLGVDHAQIGAFLLGLWGIPFTIVEAVANHHKPEPTIRCRMDVLAAVHIADALSKAKEIKRSPLIVIPELIIDPNYLKSNTIKSKVVKWLDAA